MRKMSSLALLPCLLLAGCADGRRALRPDLPPLRERVTVRMVVSLLGPQARALAGGESLRPGDGLRVSVEVERKVFVYLIDINAGRPPELLFPVRPEDDERVDPGAPLLIPPGQALRLGEAPGEERLVLIAAARPLAPDTLPALLAGSARRGVLPPDDPVLRDQLKDPRLIGRQKQRLSDDLRRTLLQPSCVILQKELDTEGIALLCLSFRVGDRPSS